MVIPSIFMENDWKCHMSINIETGMWQCFKTSQRGNFIKLYSILENCPYYKAESKLIFNSLWETGVFDPPPDGNKITPTVNVEEIYASAISVVDGSPAFQYLKKRQLLDILPSTPKEFTDGEYWGRVVFPFLNDNKVFFFQARTYGHHKNKYKNPKGLASANFLYPFDTTVKKLVVCEGPIDAITLNGMGIPATCTMGSRISRTQMEYLSTFAGELILAYHDDPAGRSGVRAFDSMRKILRMGNFKVAFSPKGSEDWNDAYCRGRKAEIRESIEEAKPFDSFEFMLDDLKEH